MNQHGYSNLAELDASGAVSSQADTRMRAGGPLQAPAKTRPYGNVYVQAER
jgi:hypothetical protein